MDSNNNTREEISYSAAQQSRILFLGLEKRLSRLHAELAGLEQQISLIDSPEALEARSAALWQLGRIILHTAEALQRPLEAQD